MGSRCCRRRWGRRKRKKQMGSDKGGGAPEVACCGITFWWYVALIVALVCFAGLMAGLTLGLMSLDLVDLEVLIKSGRPLDRVHAVKIFPVVKNPHLLLCTLLIGNAMAMESLPIFLDKLVPPWAAILVSVTLILMFGEILPQAICSRYGMAVGATMAPFVRLLLIVFSPVAYPISKVLDWLLGKGHAVLFRRAELKTYVSFHENKAGKGGDLSHDETNIISGALELTEKTAKDAMTSISRTFSLDLDGNFDVQTFNLIMLKGHSRVPVYVGKPNNIIGLILIRNLLTHDPKDAVPLRKLIIRKIPRVSESMSLYHILNEFRKGHSHIAAVVKDKNDKELMEKIKEVKLRGRKFKIEKHKTMPDSSLKEAEEKDGVNHNSVRGLPDFHGSPSTTVKKDGDQYPRNHSSEAPILKKWHTKSFDYILDVDRAPIPEFPPNEEVVGIITMEDVIEELLQEEILDETDEYINIQSRIKVNMPTPQRNAQPSD